MQTEPNTTVLERTELWQSKKGTEIYFSPASRAKLTGNHGIVTHLPFFNNFPSWNN
jgi:hypothetical protein